MSDRRVGVRRATSSTGAQSTVMPTSRSRSAINRADNSRRRQRVVAAEFRVETRRGGIGRPMRRTHPLHAPALLIDQHGRVGASDEFAEGARQRAQLLAIRDVALEQDQPPRARLAR